MKKKIRLLVLVNWEEQGRWYFYRRISEQFSSVQLMQPVLYNFIPAARWQQATIWLSEFYLPLRALGVRSSYDVIVSWSMRLGIWYGLLNRLFRTRAAPCHLIYDFHINPTRTDPAYRLRLMLLHAAIPGIDFFLSTSREEAVRYSRMFNIHPERICFFPMIPPPHYCDVMPQPPGNYILAYGNSDRDYDTLVHAAATLPVQTIILSQRYQPRQPLPANITLVTQKTVGDELINLIARARLVVLPLKHSAVAAGQTAMLEVMALGRPLIVTDNPATREYAVHNESALFYTAGRTEQLREHLHVLLNNPAHAETMGRKAREVSRTYPERQVAVFCRVVEKILS